MTPTLGKRILITGASSGIGLGLAKALLKSHNDIALYLVARTVEPMQALSEAYPERVYYHSADITSPHDRMQVVKWIKELTTPLTHVVNCAGALAPLGSLDELTENEFNQNWLVNAQGPFFLVRDLMPRLAPKARILFFSSGVVQYRNKGTAAYTISKIGLEAMCGLLIAEYKDKAKFACIRPGVVDTAMTALMAQASPETCPFVTVLQRMMKQGRGIYSVEAIASFIKKLLLDIPDDAYEKTWDIDKIDSIKQLETS